MIEAGGDDDHLVAAIARGDASAFRALVDRHAPMLYRLAFRMLGDGAEAEDIVQESLVRMWDRAAGWSAQGGGVPAWLRRTATNLCIDRIRRGTRIGYGEPPDVADDRAGVEHAIDEGQMASATRHAVLALPERQRAAIVLTYYEEQPNNAAAELLEMNIKAFESLLFRARAALRASLVAAGITAADIGGEA